METTITHHRILTPINIEYRSKTQVNAALDETTWQALNGLRNYYRAIGKINEFPEDLNKRMDKLNSDMSGADDSNPSNAITEAEYNALPSGAEYIHPARGKVIKE